MTPSSRFLEQDKQVRTSPYTQYSATPPPSRSEQHSPYADHAGNVVSQTTHSNNRVISAADLYPEETEEQNRVTFVCPADEDEQEDISGSKEFVCIRL